jgi:hypothetical protein
VTPLEAARVLAKAAAYDRRTVGDAEIMAWLEALSDLDCGDCLDAVGTHYRTSTDWLMPAHVRRIVTEVDRDRHRTVREAAEQADRLALAAQPTTDRRREILAALRAVLPPGDPDKLRWGTREWRQLQRDYHRQCAAQPNPHFERWQPPESRKDSEPS